MQSLPVEHTSHYIGPIISSSIAQETADANHPMNGFSQCDTICDDGEGDEHSIEADEDTDLDDGNQANRQEEESDMTDASSACKSDSTDDDSMSQSHPSPDAEDMLNRIPDIAHQYKVLRKIGEGSDVSLLISKHRHIQLCL